MRLTPAGVYPTAAFNFGPNVWTFRHRDIKNYAFGWCAIQSLGPFNSETGGHLVLDDLERVVEFPSGSVILIPSATLTHANIHVAKGEKRASFTQYFPGGILRFVDNKFQTEVSIKKKGKKAWEALQETKAKGWEIGMSIYKKLSELVVYDDPE